MKFSTFRKKVNEIKSEAQVLLLAYKDARTPVSSKLLIGLTIAYLLSPVDLIPDFIPVLGLLDDLLLVPLLIKISIKLIPENVLREARQEAKDHPEKLKKTNWFFAILIVMIWLIVLYFLFRRLE